jgi:hypothetical protein
MSFFCFRAAVEHRAFASGLILHLTVMVLAMVRKTVLTCGPRDCCVVLAPWVVRKYVSVARIDTLVTRSYSTSI